MTPPEALDVLRKATENLAGTRSDHLTILDALNVLKEATETPRTLELPVR